MKQEIHMKGMRGGQYWAQELIYKALTAPAGITTEIFTFTPQQKTAMKYKKKNKIVDAIQVEGTPENDKIISAFVERLVGLKGYEVPNGTFAGDYVKIGRNGARVISKSKFEDKFKPFDECETIFNPKKLKKLAKAYKKINKDLLHEIAGVKGSATPTKVIVDETTNHASDAFDYAIADFEKRKKAFREKMAENGRRPSPKPVDNKIVDLRVYKLPIGTGYGCTTTRGLPFDATCYSETAGGAKSLCEKILTVNGYTIDAIDWPEGMDLAQEEAAKVFRSFGCAELKPEDMIAPCSPVASLEDAWTNVDPSPIEMMHDLLVREFHKYRGNSRMAATAITSSDLHDWLDISKKEIFSKWPILKTPVPKDTFIRYSKYDPQPAPPSQFPVQDAWEVLAKDIRDNQKSFNGFKFNVAESIMKEIYSNPGKPFLELIARGAEHFVDVLSAQDKDVQALWLKNAAAWELRMSKEANRVKREPTLNEVLDKSGTTGESVSQARKLPCLSAAITVLQKHLNEDSHYRHEWIDNIARSIIDNWQGVLNESATRENAFFSAHKFINLLRDNSEEAIERWAKNITKV